jgi:hypothetical protein
MALCFHFVEQKAPLNEQLGWMLLNSKPKAAHHKRRPNGCYPHRYMGNILLNTYLLRGAPAIMIIDVMTFKCSPILGYIIQIFMFMGGDGKIIKILCWMW